MAEPDADDGAAVALRVTTGEGTYLFSGLTPGDYFVQVAKPAEYDSFSPQDQGDNDALDSDVDPTGLTAVITLTSGENNTTRDAGLYNLASLANLVWEDINRDGVRQASESIRGVKNVTVTLTGGGADGIIGTGGDDTTVVLVTNGCAVHRLHGRNVFTGLNPGEEYKVTFRDLPAGFRFTTQNVGRDDTVDSDSDILTGMTRIVALSSGEFNDALAAGIVPLAARSTLAFHDHNTNDSQTRSNPPFPTPP